MHVWDARAASDTQTDRQTYVQTQQYKYMPIKMKKPVTGCSSATCLHTFNFWLRIVLYIYMQLLYTYVGSTADVDAAAAAANSKVLFLSAIWIFLSRRDGVM